MEENLVRVLQNFSVFFFMYLVIYFIGYFFVFRNWSPKIRPEASSCLISFAHGTPVVFIATYAILVDSSHGFASLNTEFQNLVLDYSIAYFLMDLLHFLVFAPSDVLFIAHHLATLFVFVTCRYLVYHGAYAILVLLILAESTSFCQNSWTLAGARRNDVEFAAKVYEFLAPPFYALYTIARGFAGPYFLFQMGVFYMSGAADSVIPRWLSISWICVVSMAISVSILWISNLWIDMYRQRIPNSKKKLG